MKHIAEDKLNIGDRLSALWMVATGKGQLLTMLRASRPNWSHRRCLMAAQYLRGSGLKSFADYGAVSDYLAYLDGQLNHYADLHPVAVDHEVADKLTLCCWERRWRRVRAHSTAVAGKTDNGRGSAQEMGLPRADLFG